jgi:hypothetical protein
VETDQVAELNNSILEGDPSVVKALRKFPSRCVEDDKSITPFAAAIKAHARDVIDLLLEDTEAIEYCPAFDKALASQIKMMLDGTLMGTLENTEQHLLDHHFVEDPYWRRTPLLEACRWGNEYVIGALVAAGADLSARDVLGQGALDLCLHDPADGMALVLLDSCLKAGRQYPVRADQLETVVRRPTIWDHLLAHGKLDAKAKRFAFNLACARLDVEAVEHMIAGNYKPQSAVSFSKHPVIEAATSHSVYVHGLPEFTELAAGFAHMYGHPDSFTISSDDLFDEDGKSISFALAQQRNQSRNAALKWKDRDAKFVPDEQLKRRLALLDVLAEQGLEPGKYGEDHIHYITATNRPELLERLQGFGFKTSEIAKDDISWAIAGRCLSMAEALHARRESAGRPVKAPEATWELPGESGISAQFAVPPVAGEPAILEIVLDCSYCPLDGVDLFVRIGDPEAATPPDGFSSVTDWIPADLIKESLFVDDEEVPRGEVDEPLASASPWEALHGVELVLSPGSNRIEIALVSEELEDFNCVLSDWVLKTDGTA